MPIPTILLILAALSVGATIVAIIIAFRSDRESRSAIFPIIREEEAVRARRARLSVFVWAAVTALFLGGWLASLRLAGSMPTIVSETTAEQTNETVALAVVTEPPAPIDEPPTTNDNNNAQQSSVEAIPPTDTVTPSPTSTGSSVSVQLTNPTLAVIPSPTPVPPTLTPLPTATPQPPTATSVPSSTPLPPTATATQTPSPTATPLPTETPTPTPILARLPISSTRKPAPTGAKMGPIKFATAISPDNEPINPDDLFPQGIDTVYAVFPYSGMENGVDFKVIWYQDGVELWRDENRWDYGDEARFYSFITSPDEGLYKLELHVNDSILATGLFEVR